MNSKELKEHYEQLSSDYEILGNYYESLKEENGQLEQSLKLQSQENQLLLEQIDELKQIIAMLLEQNLPMDRSLRSFFSKTLRENISLRRKDTLNDSVPF
mgnify:CR=1 FL=1